MNHCQSLATKKPKRVMLPLFYVKIKIDVMPRSDANCEVGHEPDPD
jgi:hypothetical protein